MTLRKTIFWLHLVAGLVAGLVIGIMSFTGAALAFEKDLVAWAERDAREVTPPENATRLDLNTLRAHFTVAHPDVTPTAITLLDSRTAAVAFQVGRSGTYYVNPYTGEVLQPASTRMDEFMHLMTSWHRWLAMEGEGRATGKAITGACNAAFLVLAITGLYLWWPRKWRLKGMKRSLWFVRSATSKARDWNWHNVIGFWSLPVLIVLTASGMVISYPWAGNLVYKLAGEEAPARRGPPGQRGPDGPPAGEQRPGAGERSGSTNRGAATPAPVKLNLDEAFARAVVAEPEWISITLPLGEREANNATVKTPGMWPRTASTTLTFDPATGKLAERSAFADQSTGRQARTWLRFLHTGEALGWWGQLVAGLACVGGCVLVYTGFALSWRRFFTRKPATA